MVRKSKILNIKSATDTDNFKRDPGTPVYFDDVIEKYLFLKRDLKPTTLRTVKSRIENWIRPYFGNKELEEINKEYILNWFIALKEKLRSNSQRQTVNILKAIFRVAVEFFDLKEDPISKIKFNIRSDQKEKEIWTRGQFREFIKSVDDPHYKIFYQVLFYTGLRIGEIRGLLFKDIDVNTGKVSVNKNLQSIDGEEVFLSTKTTSSERTVYIPDTVLEEYRAYLNLIGKYDENDRVFNRSRFRYERYLKRYCVDNNIPVITLHSLRHSIGTILLEEGIAPNDIQYMLGHTNVSTTLRMYLHTREDGIKRIIDHLNKTVKPV